MTTERFRNALGAFGMVLIFGGLALGAVIFVSVVAFNPSGTGLGNALVAGGKAVIGGVLGGGILRTLISIDARLEQRT